MAREGRPAEAPGAGGDELPTRLSELIREVVAVPEAGSAASWNQSLRPGATVGRFELVRELGRGGFGVVYEARDLEQDRLVAFKAVLPGRRADEAFESLRREAEALGRLAHPNIVELLDAGRGPEGPWLSMELLRGQTLSQRLALGAVPVGEAVRVATEVARGLAHAHAHGVVHRDLSPRNVYLCHDGQVKLLDLGLAHVFGRRRVAGGTPSYVAPEQWRDAPEDERTDVFSLGVMLFRMLAGEFPSPEEGGTRDHPVPRVEVAGAPALGPLVARMLARDPVERPRDAGEVLKALEAFQAELDRSPTTLTMAPRVRRPLSPRARRRWLGAALAAAVAALALAGWRLGREALRPPPSIAVLPFEDLSPERDPSNFAAGLSEEVQGALGALEGLKVPGRISSAALKGRGAPLAEIGRILGVGAVLDGSVRRQGRRLKVVAEIVEASSGARLWSRAFDRELTDAFDVQEEIAAAVVQALDVKLVRREGTTGRERPAPDPEAYAGFLAAREEVRQKRPGWPRRAAALLGRAVELDPEFAPAWALLASARSLEARDARAYGTIRTPEEELALRRQAMAAAERAVALDPALPEAWAARGALRGDLDFDVRGARVDLERARALNANDPYIRGRYAMLLLASGQEADAIREARAATELDPLSPSWATLGVAHLAAGDLVRAEAAVRRALEVAPEGVVLRPLLAWLLILRGQGEAALQVVGEEDAEGTRLWTEAAAAQVMGRQARAREATDAWVREHGERSEFEAAALMAHTGRTEEAFAWLRRAVAARRPAVFTHLRWWPFFRSLHGDPRFEAIRQEVEGMGQAARR